MRFQSLGWEDPLEEGVATDSSIHGWRILWTEEPGKLQSIGSWRVGHSRSNLATHTGVFNIISNSISYQMFLSKEIAGQNSHDGIKIFGKTNTIM